MDENGYTPNGDKYLPDDIIKHFGDKIKAYVSGYVSQHPSGVQESDIATDDEVAEMLDDVFSSVVE